MSSSSSSPEETTLSLSTTTSLADPFNDRGLGRGRNRTLPAWMSQTKQSSDAPSKGLSSPELSTRKRMWDSGTTSTSATNTTALAPPSSLGRGRGMNRTRPSWMSTEAWSTHQDHLPPPKDSGATHSLAHNGVNENVSPNPNDIGKWEEHTKGIGGKLLKKWGHKEGEGLGAKGDGLAEPVKAVVLPHRVGLGHVSKKQSNKKNKSTTSTSSIGTDNADDSTTQANIVKLIQEKKNISLGQFKQLYQSRFEKELCHKGKLNVALKKVPGVTISSNQNVTFTIGKENVKPAAKSAPEEQVVQVSNKDQAVSKKMPAQASNKQQPKKKTQVVKHVVQMKKTKKKKLETDSEDNYLVNLVHRLTSENAHLQYRITELEAELAKAKAKASNKQS